MSPKGKAVFPSSGNLYHTLFYSASIKQGFLKSRRFTSHETRPSSLGKGLRHRSKQSHSPSRQYTSDVQVSDSPWTGKVSGSLSQVINNQSSLPSYHWLSPDPKTPLVRFLRPGVSQITNRADQISIDSTSATNRPASLPRNEATTLNTASLKPPMFRMSSRSGACDEP